MLMQKFLEKKEKQLSLPMPTLLLYTVLKEVKGKRNNCCKQIRSFSFRHSCTWLPVSKASNKHTVTVSSACQDLGSKNPGPDCQNPFPILKEAKKKKNTIVRTDLTWDLCLQRPKSICNTARIIIIQYLQDAKYLCKISQSYFPGY